MNHTWSLPDRTITRLGYGAMHLTGPGMWGPPEDPEAAKALLRRAVHELGVTFVDTADSYGPGDNERIIRDALAPYPDDLVVATKGGMLRSGPDDWRHGPGTTPYIVALGRPAYLRQQVELSLRNLGVDTIELYMLHRIDPVVPLADQLGALVEMQQQGKIRHIGLSGQPTVPIALIEQARETAEIVAVENLFNVADQSGGDVVDWTAEQGIALLPWFPLGHGDLMDPGGPLVPVAERCGVTVSQLCLAWLLRRSPNTVLIPGTTSIAHLEDNMGAAAVELTVRQWDEVEKAAATITPWRPEATAGREAVA